jgi:hypothetical protein
VSESSAAALTAGVSAGVVGVSGKNLVASMAVNDAPDDIFRTTWCPAFLADLCGGSCLGWAGVSLPGSDGIDDMDALDGISEKEGTGGRSSSAVGLLSPARVEVVVLRLRVFVDALEVYRADDADLEERERTWAVSETSPSLSKLPA